VCGGRECVLALNASGMCVWHGLFDADVEGPEPLPGDVDGKAADLVAHGQVDPDPWTLFLGEQPLPRVLPGDEADQLGIVADVDGNHALHVLALGEAEHPHQVPDGPVEG